jgi:two-component system, OmpR family, phosphate regulon sensor histidine kinase PhoR
MKQMTIGKFVGTWSVLSVVLIIIGAFWLRPDVMPQRAHVVVFKIVVLLAALSAAGFLLVYAVARSWSLHVQRLQEFAEAPLEERGALSEDSPLELLRLSRAMKRNAERVRDEMERANLELSHRETILAAMAEGVLAVDQNVKVIFCNDAFARAFGTRTRGAAGRTFYEVVREPTLRNMLERVVHSGSSERDRFRMPSAGGRWFEARALPLGNAPARGAVVVLHDITDIQHQEQVRKDFVADVSHELRTPLSAIRGYAETLLDGALHDVENSRKFVEIILAQTIRLNNIASDLLVLSELDSGAAPDPPESVALRELIESALNTVQSEATLRHVQLKRGELQDCSVAGYRFRLEQALVNLLDNAVKFNRPDGEVTVECGRTEDGRVSISVRDTGIGIAREDLKRIFERFYRVDKARSRPTGGTGLGLPIVKEVIERMGGCVEVESQLGRGSTFTILLQGG